MEAVTSEANIGARLRAARLATGMSLRRLAEELDVSAATMSAVENGRTVIRPARLAAAAGILGLDPAELVVGPAAELSLESASSGDWRVFESMALPVVLQGALAAFVDLGYHGATIRDIANRAGLSVPGVYHHFASKHQLLVALLDLTMADLAERIGKARAEGDDPVQRVSNLVECLALYHTHRRELGFLGASEMRSVQEPDRTRIATLRTMVQRNVDEEVLEGRRRDLFATLQPYEASRAVVTMCTALAQWWSPSGPDAPEVIARKYVELALDLLKTTPPSR